MHSGESERELPERQEKTQQSPVLEGKKEFPDGPATVSSAAR